MTFYLQFFKGKSSTGPDLGVISKGRASDDGSDGTSDRTGSDLDGFFLTSYASSLLASRLIEPGLDISLPIFVKMSIGDHIVTLGSHGGLVKGNLCNKNKSKN